MTISEPHAELTRLIAEGHGGLDVVITISQWSEGFHGDEEVWDAKIDKAYPFSQGSAMTERVLRIS